MAYEKQTWVDGQSRLSAERMNHIESGIAGASSRADNAVTINTDQTVTGKKEFTNADGIGTNAVHNTAGNAMLRYKSTEDKIVVGSSTKPLTLMGSGDRPTYSKDGSDFSGNAVAMLNDVNSLASLLWANLGIGRWANQTLINFSWQSSSFNDNLLPYYSDCTRFAAYTKTALTSITLNNKFKDNATINFAFYNFDMPSNGTLVLQGRVSSSKNWIYTCEATFMGFKGAVIKSLGTFNITDRALQTFANCSNLTTIEGFDFSNVVEMNGVFDACPKLKSIKCTGFKISFNISSSTAFEQADLVELISSLETVSNGAVLTMGTTNLAKLTTDQIAVATGKGWTLA